MLLSGCRKAVDTFVPPLGRSYRLLRDATNRQRSIETAYGFHLAGDPAMAGRGWEGEEVRVLLELMNVHDAMLDIGANVGFYSCLGASRGFETLAFEPSPRNLKFLYRNLWENRFWGVEVFPLGLGAQRGLARIYGFGGVASFVRGWAQAREAQSSLVPMTTLDTIAAGRFSKKRLLIKLDVEGFELDVLAGAAETLRLHHRPAWMVEVLLRSEVIPNTVNQRFAQVFELFWSHGYRCTTLDAERTAVNPEDVNRWVRNGSVERDVHDFLFRCD